MTRKAEERRSMRRRRRRRRRSMKRRRRRRRRRRSRMRRRSREVSKHLRQTQADKWMKELRKGNRTEGRDSYIDR